MSSALATADKMPSTSLTIIIFLAPTCFWAAHGLYDVACPGVNSELKCPEGQVITVESMQSGDKSSADCDDRQKPATLFDEKNLHSQMLPWTKFICDGLQRCRLSKPHPRMFLSSENAADKFLQITYSCNEKSPGIQTSITCEGETAKLTCETGTLSIEAARYGRFDENICTKGDPSTLTFCASYFARGAVMTNCQDQQECNIDATSDALGDPMYCDDKPKYLTVDYKCV